MLDRMAKAKGLRREQGSDHITMQSGKAKRASLQHRSLAWLSLPTAEGMRDPCHCPSDRTRVFCRARAICYSSPLPVASELYAAIYYCEKS